MDLETLGWDSDYEQSFESLKAAGLTPARIAQQHKHGYLGYGASGELSATLAGRFRHDAADGGAYPTVGDWVAVQAQPQERKAIIHALLPRRSCFSRKVAGGKTEEQVVAANVDTVFLVSGLDGDFNVRRIERYLSPAWDSGANPVIVLNKADLCGDLDGRVAEVEAVAFGVPVLTTSAADGAGMVALRTHAGPGKTAAFLGSSGVGKSSLINALLGTERQKVVTVRDDDSRGRHTTTRRELILLPGGGLVIDTPGMRELQLWADEEGMRHTFADVEDLAAQCRFRDCGHGNEPGCAVREAIEEGVLEAGRYQSYLKQQRELQHLARRQDHRARLDEKAKWKKITQEYRRTYKNKR